MATNLPPPPISEDKISSFIWQEWFRQVRNYLVGQGGLIPWSSVSKDTSNITDIPTRLHNTLQSLQGGGSGEFYHITQKEHDGIYGSMYVDNGAIARTIAATNTYYQLASGFTTGACSNVTFQNARELKCDVAGTYLVTWQMSRSVPGATQEVEGGILKNGSILLNTTAHTQSQTAGTQQSFSGTGIVSLAVNDLLSLAINNNTSTNTVTISHGQLVMHYMGP